MQKRVFKKEDYVSFDSATNKSTCLLCKKVLCGFVIGNIKRHYEKVHDIKFQKKYAQHTVVVVEGKTNAADTSLATDADTTNGDRELRLNKCEFLKCCVGLVTVNNLPLRIFDDDEFFKKLISTYEDEFDLNLNSSNIIDSIDFWALRVKLCLKGKFKQKMLSLNIDVANRMKKNVMVINVKCIERYRFVTYTLAVVPLKSKQSAQVLKEEILKCLADFDIDLKQLYALTGDSRGCVMAALNLIQQESEDNQYENAMVTDEFDASSEDFKSTLSIIKCGYHTIKLVVREFFTSVESNLSELRGIVELIRGKYDPDGDIAMPSLDNITRWESTYEMVCTLKEFLMHYKLEFKIEWEFVEPFIEALKPLVECSKQLQTEQYIIGDFYRDWLLCEAKLRKMKHNNNAIKLLTVMLDAHQKILYNEAFNAALYLDPRFNYLDSPYFRDDRKKQAVDHILRTDAAAQDMKTRTATVATTNECGIVNETITSLWTEDPYNILEEELHSMSKNTSSAQENLSLRQKLANLTYTHRQPFATNILEYWKNHPIKDPDVHNTLQIILAVSTNQASMERAHSALSTVLTKQKSNLSQTNLMNILLVKLNGSVLTDIDP